MRTPASSRRSWRAWRAICCRATTALRGCSGCACTASTARSSARCASGRRPSRWPPDEPPAHRPSGRLGSLPRVRRRREHRYRGASAGGLGHGHEPGPHGRMGHDRRPHRPHRSRSDPARLSHEPDAAPARHAVQGPVDAGGSRRAPLCALGGQRPGPREGRHRESPERAQRSTRISTTATSFAPRSGRSAPPPHGSSWAAFPKRRQTPLCDDCATSSKRAVKETATYAPPVRSML